MENDEAWLSGVEACALAGWSPATLRRRVRAGRLAAYSRDGRVVFRLRDLEASLRAVPMAADTERPAGR